jgi:hypothetical protein
VGRGVLHGEIHVSWKGGLGFPYLFWILIFGFSRENGFNAGRGYDEAGRLLIEVGSHNLSIGWGGRKASESEDSRERPMIKYADMLRIKQVVEDMKKPLSEASYMLFISWKGVNDSSVLDEKAAILSSKSRDLLQLLDFQIESERAQYAYDQLRGKVRNLEKMLKAYAGVRTGEDLVQVLTQQNTKGKTPYDKFRDYADLVTGFVHHFDSKHETTLRVGPYEVVLFSVQGKSWDPARVSVLKEVLGRTEKLVRRVGLPQVVGGKVYAFPVPYLPLSVARSKSLAWYRPKEDTMAMAIGDKPNIDRLVSTMVHETGHRAYFKIMEGRGRTAWHALFDTHQGEPPQIEDMLSEWEAWAGSDGSRRYLAYYLADVRKRDPKTAMWLTLIADSLDIQEAFSPYGTPKKGSEPGLDQIKRRRSEVKVFLYPVTAYSGHSAEELYAEVFARICLEGHNSVEDLVRAAFYGTLPQFKSSKVSSMSDLRRSIIKLAYAHPELRPHLLPLVKEATSEWKRYRDQEYEKFMHTKVRNPSTDNEVLLSTLSKKPKDSPEYKVFLVHKKTFDQQMSKAHARYVEEKKDRKFSKEVYTMVSDLDIGDDHLEEIAAFAKGKPVKGKPLTHEQLLQRFLKKCKPETRERVKDMDPGDFAALLHFLREEEEES